MVSRLSPTLNTMVLIIFLCISLQHSFAFLSPIEKVTGFHNQKILPSVTRLTIKHNNAKKHFRSDLSIAALEEKKDNGIPIDLKAELTAYLKVREEQKADENAQK